MIVEIGIEAFQLAPQRGEQAPDALVGSFVNTRRGRFTAARMSALAQKIPCVE